MLRSHRSAGGFWFQAYPSKELCYSLLQHCFRHFTQAGDVRAIYVIDETAVQIVDYDFGRTEQILSTKPSALPDFEDRVVRTRQEDLKELEWLRCLFGRQA